MSMFKQLDNLTIGLLVAVVVLLGVVIYLFVTRNSGSNDNFAKGPPPTPHLTQGAYPPPPHHAPQGGPQARMDGNFPTLAFFHATWCPHCTAPEMTNAWQETKQALAGKVQTEEIESKDPRTAQHTLKGYPTIRYFPQGLGHPDKFVEFKGQRNAQALIQFALSGGAQM